MNITAVLQSGLSKKTLRAFLVPQKSKLICNWPLATGFINSILDQAKSDGFRGKPGDFALVRLVNGHPYERVLLIGGDEETYFSLETVRRFAATAVRRAQKLAIPEMAIILPQFAKPTMMEEAQAAAEGAVLGSYQYTAYKSKNSSESAALDKVWIASGAKDFMSVREGVKRGQIAADAVNFARDLVNRPPSDKTPEYLGKWAQSLSGNGVKVRVFHLKDLEKLKMNALLGVARGSDKAPPVFVHLHYKPSKKPARKIAICGKGVTFDSGGLCIKPADAMDTMKMDMSGAACVLGIFKALKILAPNVEIHGCIPFTENMPGDAAYKPGDILKALNGKTIEVLNTDAEGRVILADALSFAAKLDVDHIIDIATLTGACIVALGPDISGLMGNNDALLQRLEKAAAASGEKVWRLPLPREYHGMIKSKIADIKNIGPKREAGTIVGGLFLQEFVSGKAWAHLDIAGPAWAEKESPLSAIGGTGVMVRTLLRDILN